MFNFCGSRRIFECGRVVNAVFKMTHQIDYIWITVNLSHFGIVFKFHIIRFEFCGK